MTYDVKALRSELVDDEGIRLKPYLCPAGYYSIGIGHNLDANGIPAHVVDVLFYHDVAQAEIDLNRLDPNWREHPDEVQRAMINLVFNLGAGGWAKFKNTRAALARKDYEAAAKGLADSKWAKQVQKSRSSRIIAQISGAAAVVAVALVAMMPGAAGSHDWYQTECGSERDCRPVRECVLPDGRLGLEFMLGRCVPINWNRVRSMPAPDGQWHACIPQKLIIGTPDPKCIYGPLGDA